MKIDHKKLDIPNIKSINYYRKKLYFFFNYMVKIITTFNYIIIKFYLVLGPLTNYF